MLRRFSRTLAVLGLATLPLAISSNASAQTKIAVVDVQSVVLSTEDGRRAAATFKKAFDKSQHDLDVKQEELRHMKEDIERQALVLSREALARRTEDWQRRMIELQTLYVDYRDQIQKKQQQLYAPINKKVFRLIERLAKRNGYDVIIDAVAIPYARSDLNLTEQVIQMYNSGGDGGGDAPDPAGNAPAPEPGGDKPATP